MVLKENSKLYNHPSFVEELSVNDYVLFRLVILTCKENYVCDTDAQYKDQLEEFAIKRYFTRITSGYVFSPNIKGLKKRDTEMNTSAAQPEHSDLAPLRYRGIQGTCI